MSPMEKAILIAVVLIGLVLLLVPSVRDKVDGFLTGQTKAPASAAAPDVQIEPVLDPAPAAEPSPAPVPADPTPTPAVEAPAGPVVSIEVEAEATPHVTAAAPPAAA